MKISPAVIRRILAALTVAAMGHSALCAEAISAAPAQRANRAEVAFVDSAVAGYEVLLAGIDPAVEVVLIRAGQDGIRQMSNTLAGRTGLDAIHVISHGSAAELRLGGATLTIGGMCGEYASALGEIGQSLKESGDLLVYGCDFGAGDRGSEAAGTLSRLTGADVAASTNLTGSTSLGGDWILEQLTGSVETGVVVSLEAQQGWHGVLQDPPRQFFYLPLPEQEILASMEAINAAVDGTTGMDSIVTITATENNTIIYFDHWENEYESNLAVPTQTAGAEQTQIWGDGNPANGAPPGAALGTDPAINAGRIITLRNTVTLPRNPATVFFDARDKIGASRTIAISRAEIPLPSGSVISTAVEVRDTRYYNTAYVAPVGSNTPLPPGVTTTFSRNFFYVQASQDSTTVQIDADNNGAFEQVVVLNEGQNVVSTTNVMQGGRVVTNKPVQTTLFTGNTGASFATRTYNLYSNAQLTNDYFTPVGDSGDDVALFVYNPNAAPITVSYETQTTSGTLPVVAPGATSFLVLTGLDTGTRLFTAGGESFAAVGAHDTAALGSRHDWGFSLQTTASLSQFAVVGLGVGNSTNPPSAGGINVSPIWVTPLAAATVYVDNDGDPATGLSLDAVTGSRYDQSFALARLEARRVTDTTGGDNDNSGMRLFTNDGTLISLAWGEDTAAPAGAPGFDAGTTVPAIPVPEFFKTADFAPGGDANGDGFFNSGDTMRYMLQIRNIGTEPVSNAAISDALPTTLLTYVPNSTTIDQGAGAVPIPDGGVTAFPLDEGGYTILNMNSGTTTTVVFDATVNASLPTGTFSILNLGRLAYQIYNLPAVADTKIRGTVSGTAYVDTNNDGDQDAGEAGISGVTMTLTGTDILGAAVSKVATTDASGFYVFTDLKESNGAGYTVTQTQPVGYSDGLEARGGVVIPGSGGGSNAITGIAVIPGENDTDNNFGEIGSSLSGTVYSDLDNDGVIDGGEAGIAGVTVNLTGTDAAGNPVSLTGVTLASGAYTFDGLRAGTYAIAEVQPAGFFDGADTIGTPGGTTANDLFSSIVLAASFNGTGNNFGERAPGTVIGHLYRDTNGNGSQEVGEPNLANVNVVVTDSLGVIQTVVTDAAGNWTASVPPGSTSANVDETDPDFVLQVPAGYTQTEGTDPTAVVAVSGGVVSAGNDGYFNPATLSGHLYVDTNGNGVQNVGEPNIANVNVVVTDSLGVIQTVVTDAAGNWTAVVPPGLTSANVDETDVDFVAQVPVGYVQTEGTDPTAVVAVANAATSAGNDGYFNPATLSGHLYVDTDGDGTQDIGEPNLANVNVVITDSNGVVQTVVTDAAGNWTAVVPPGATGVNVDETDPDFALLVPAGYVQTEGTDPTNVNAIANASVSAGNDGYYNPATVTGHLYVDTNGNGVQEVGESNIANVNVVVTDSLGVIQTVVTDAAGNWTAVVPPGATSANVDETDADFVAQVPAGYVQTEGTDPTAVVAVANAATSAGNDGYFNPATLSGHLYVDTNGNGVQGVGEPNLANVNVVITDSNGVVQTVVTDAAGNWTAVVPPGLTSANVDETDVDFVAQVPAGYVQTEGTDPTAVVAVANAATSAGNDGYYNPATVTGHLYVDTNGNGVQEVGEPNIANVNVVVTDSLGVIQTVVTDAAGNWTAVVPPGATSANVDETDADFVAQVPAGYVQTEGTDPTAVVAVANAATSAGNDGYFNPATLSGHLYVDTNGNGVQEVGESNIANVNVVVTDSLGVIQTVVTDAAGNWTAVVPPGATSANVDETDADFVAQVPVGYVQTEGTDPTGVVAVANAATSAGNDGYFNPATLSGHLYVDTDGDGTQDIGEPNLANVNVVITDSNGVVQTVVTDAAGNWTAVVPPGATGVNVDETDPDFVLLVPAGYVQTEGTDPTNVNAIANASVSAGNDGYYNPATVTGHLYVDTNGNGVQEVGEPNIANVNVVVTDSLGVIQTVVTDAAGNWTAVVPPGLTSANVDETDVDFVAQVPAGYVQTEGTDPTGVVAVANAATSAGNDGYFNPATLSGHLYVDTNGNGVQNVGEPNIANVNVVVTDSLGVIQTVVTDAAGNWTAVVPPGLTSANVDETDVDFVAQVPVGYVQTEGTDPTAVVAVANAATSAGNDGYFNPATLSGHLYVDTDGDGTQDIGEPNLANVNVVITDSNGVVQTVVTDAAGNWTAVVPPGATGVNVDETDPDFALLVPAGYVQTEGTDPTNVNAIANASVSAGNDGYYNPATVTGHLYVDTNGNGVQEVGESNIANVNVVVTDSLGVIQTVVTDAAGNWTAVVPPGATSANVDETDADFVAQVPAGYVQTEGTDPTAVVAVANAATSAGNDGYFNPATLSGHLYVDTNGNGVQGVGEPNLANVNVVITDSNGVVQTVVTDAAGNWTAVVPPGLTSANVDETDVDFVAQVPVGYVQTEGTDPTGVVAVANAATSAGNDGYYNPATVTGHLYVDTNGNGVQEVGEPDLPNVRLIVTDSTGAIQTVVTDIFGNWMAAVPPGSTTADVDETDPNFITQVPAGYTQTEGTDPTVVIAAANANTDAGVDGFALLSADLFVISGSVLNDDPADNNVFDALDTPIGNVTVTLYRDVNGDGIAQPGEFVASTVTRVDSTYAFPEQPNGPYLVVETNRPGAVSDADSDGAANGNDLVVVPLAGADVTGVDFLDDGIETYTVAGRVTDGTNPIPGVIITLCNLAGDFLGAATTIADGTYVFAYLPDAGYVVKETNPPGTIGGSDVDGGNPDLINFTIAGANVIGRDFVDNVPGSSLHAISGSVYLDDVVDNNVIDPLDAGIGNVTVRLYREVNGDGIPQAAELVDTIVTLVGGGYTFSGLSDGDYYVEEFNPGAAVSDADADGLANGNDLIAVALAGADSAGNDFLDDGIEIYSICGSVSDGLNLIPGVTITLFNSSGDFLGTVPTDAAGAYCFAGLPDATYTVIETNPPGTVGGSDYDAGDPDNSTVIIAGADVLNVNFSDLLPDSIPARTIYGYCKTPLLVNALRDLPPTAGAWRIVSVSKPKYGVAKIRPDGFVLYRSSINFKGLVQDSFIVIITDDAGTTIAKRIIVKDFVRIAGTFQGMLVDGPVPPAAPVAADYTGRATITFTTNAAFSAKINLGTETLRVAGTLTGSLQYQKIFRLLDGRVVTLTLTYEDISDTWGVSIAGDLTMTAAAPVARVATSGGAFTGLYTTALVPGLAPHAGFGTITVSGSGNAKIIGRLAGGGAFTMGAKLLPDGKASYFGLEPSFTLAGVVDFADPVAPPAGSLNWIYYTTDIFGAPIVTQTTLDLQSSRYVPPAAGSSVLGAALPALDFELQDTVATSIVPAATPIKNAAFSGVLGTESFSVKVDKATGYATGSYTDTATGDVRKLWGAVIQSGTRIIGITNSAAEPLSTWSVRP